MKYTSFTHTPNLKTNDYINVNYIQITAKLVM